MKKQIAVVGGGAAGSSLLWCLASQDGPFNAVTTTLFHDEAFVGGHSNTIGVWFDAAGKGHLDTDPARKDETIYSVDIGVQFVCPTLYPNLYKQIELAALKNAVRLTPKEELKLSGVFGKGLVWGNFPEYQTAPRFQHVMDEETLALAKKFQHDVKWSLLEHIDGKSVFTMSVGDYLKGKGYSFESNFFRYLLIPYLSIVNGYGTSDLLETTIEDIFPIFTRIPLIQEKGPYGNFLSPGTGWDRFTDGAQAWVRAMGEYARERNATLKLGTFVTKVYPKDDRVVVEWTEAGKPGTQSQEFDEVVLCTDMTTNRALLDDPRNPNWDAQKGFISEQKFELLPGICYIHQDDNVLGPSLRDGKEDGQWCSEFAWGSTSPTNPFGLPYDLANSFQTYFMDNILGTPVPCYVSMYADQKNAVVPAPDKIIHQKTWRHGRWVASFFDAAKKELHEIQGLGHVWFAGNNTTVDSEEGALVSAMTIAERLSDYEYPFSKLSEAYVIYKQFSGMMFPKPSLARHYSRMLAPTNPTGTAAQNKPIP